MLNKDNFDKVLVFLMNVIISAIFFFVPILFTHISYLFWYSYHFVFSASFEPMKVCFFELSVYLLYLLHFLRIFTWNIYLKRKDILYFSILILYSFFSFIFSLSHWVSFYWSPYTSHGLKLFLTMLVFFLVLRNHIHSSQKSIWYIIKSIFFSYLFIAIYAVMQFLSLDPLSERFVTRVKLDRVFSTLWYHNSLAGFSLLIFPLVLSFFKWIKLRIIFFIILFIVIILTRSLFWIFFASIYILYTINSLFRWKIKLTSFVMTTLVSIFFFYIFFNIYKDYITRLFSLFARFYLWKSVFLAYIYDLKIFLIWNWFDSIYLVFNKIRDPMLSVYEDRNYISDSSHNIFIDYLYFYWITWFSLIFTPIFLILKNNVNSYFTHTILLFFAFFSFNPPAVSHYLILIFCLSVLSSSCIKK